MKRFLIQYAIVVVAGALLAGCESPKRSKSSQYEPPPKPKLVVTTKQITLLIDTQPSGAQLYYQARGGAWLRSQYQTPMKYDLLLRQTESFHFRAGVRYPMPYRTHYDITSINGKKLDEYPGFSGVRELDSGMKCSAKKLSLSGVRFNKEGYESYQSVSSDKHIDAIDLCFYQGKEYKVVFSLTPLKVENEVAERRTVAQPHEGFMLNLRVVGIPLGDVASTASGIASSKKEVPELLARLCDDLESGWKGQEKSRVSIIGIVEIDTKTKKNEVGRFATECLYTAVGRRKSLTLTERSQIQEFLKEHNLTIEEVVNNPKSLEKMVGIDYVILGSVSWTGN